MYFKIQWSLCNRWLDSGQDDGMIERELKLFEPGKSNYVIWKLPCQDMIIMFGNAKIDGKWWYKYLSYEQVIPGKYRFKLVTPIMQITVTTRQKFRVHCLWFCMETKARLNRSTLAKKKDSSSNLENLKILKSRWIVAFSFSCIYMLSNCSSC